MVKKIEQIEGVDLKGVKAHVDAEEITIIDLAGNTARIPVSVLKVIVENV